MDHVLNKLCEHLVLLDAWDVCGQFYEKMTYGDLVRAHFPDV